MNINRIRQLIKPLMAYKKDVVGVYVYGSVLTKKKPNDIDLLVVLEEKIVTNEKRLISIGKKINEIKLNAEKKKINLHFQPVKSVDDWWLLVMQGEPWILSSIKKSLIIFDKYGLIREVQEFIKQGGIYLREEKADRLLESSDSLILKNRELLLETIENLSSAATEAAQILLLFEGKVVINKKKIAKELAKYNEVINVGDYLEIIDLEEKFRKGVLSEFTGENLDYYSAVIKKFIDKIENKIHEQIKSIHKNPNGNI